MNISLFKSVHCSAEERIAVLLTLLQRYARESHRLSPLALNRPYIGLHRCYGLLTARSRSGSRQSEQMSRCRHRSEMFGVGERSLGSGAA